LANRFVDPTYATGTLAGTWTFTNGSTSVTGTGGNATILSAGDYVKPSTTNEWYKVASVTDDNNFTLAYNFAQATQSGVTCQYNSEDGTSASTPFCHINQATTDEVRAAGDVIYLRRGQTYLYEATDIVFDEDGSANNYITLMGDDGTGWSDESGLSRPIIDFGTGNVTFKTDYADYWKFEDIEFTNALHILIRYSQGVKANKLVSHDSRNDGFYIQLCNDGEFSECEAYDNTRHGFYIISQISPLKFKNCVSYGNGQWGFKALNYAIPIELEDCTFGSPTVNTSGDISLGSSYSSQIKGRNVTLSSSTKVDTISVMGSFVKIEDLDGTKDNNKAWLWNGTITRDTSVVRTGGADSSACVEPNSNCGTEHPLKMFDFVIWAPASQKTYSVYMYASGWTTLPTASECYIEAEYYDQAAGAHKATMQSTQAFTANDTWTEFTVTVTPAQEGILRLRGYLKKYEAGAKVYVDIKPVIS